MGDRKPEYHQQELEIHVQIQNPQPEYNEHNLDSNNLELSVGNNLDSNINIMNNQHLYNNKLTQFFRAKRTQFSYLLYVTTYEFQVSQFIEGYHHIFYAMFGTALALNKITAKNHVEVEAMSCSF